MGVQYPLSLPTGDVYPAAYAVVVEAHIIVQAHTIRVKIATFRDKASYDAGKDPVLVSDYGISDPQDENGVFQAGDYTTKFGGTIGVEAMQVDAWLAANRPEFAGGKAV